MSFEDLLVWKRAARLSADVYGATEELRDFGFRDQITRSGLSIASNIAEGYGRGGKRDRDRFLRYARGSCSELRCQIYIGIEIGYLGREQALAWARETKELSRMLSALMGG